MSTLSDLKNIEQHLRNANELAANVRRARREAYENGGEHVGPEWTLWDDVCRRHDALSNLLLEASADVRREEQRLARLGAGPVAVKQIGEGR